MVDPNDAAGITIPIAMLPSKDEDKEAVEKWEQGVKTKHIVKWYNDQVHGFMAARQVFSTSYFREAMLTHFTVPTSRTRMSRRTTWTLTVCY